MSDSVLKNINKLQVINSTNVVWYKRILSLFEAYLFEDIVDIGWLNNDKECRSKIGRLLEVLTDRISERSREELLEIDHYSDRKGLYRILSISEEMHETSRLCCMHFLAERRFDGERGLIIGRDPYEMTTVAFDGARYPRDTPVEDIRPIEAAALLFCYPDNEELLRKLRRRYPSGYNIQSANVPGDITTATESNTLRDVRWIDEFESTSGESDEAQGLEPVYKVVLRIGDKLTTKKISEEAFREISRSRDQFDIFSDPSETGRRGSRILVNMGDTIGLSQMLYRLLSELLVSKRPKRPDQFESLRDALTGEYRRGENSREDNKEAATSAIQRLRRKLGKKGSVEYGLVLHTKGNVGESLYRLDVPADYKICLAEFLEDDGE